MIDLHTHILPGMDDGAKDVDMSLQMLRAQKAQGVRALALTSHFYPAKESAERFLRRRTESAKVLARAILAMPPEEQKRLPEEMVLGAEVAWVPNLAQIEGLERLCIGKSRYMLLELPFEPWTGRLIDEIYHLQASTGILPVIAHLDRYQKLQKPELFEEILALGVPIQVGTDQLLHWWNKRQIFRLLEQEGRFFLASDCHNMDSRKPNLKEAMDVVENKLGKDFIEQMRGRTARIFGD